MSLLDKINSPSDLKGLRNSDLKQLAVEIRSFLIENVTKTGGHLSPNLGVVELTIALHYVFDSPQDGIIWDVGHQSYVHKILTGRRSGFNSLRMKGGLSGYPSPMESEHDIIHAGHSSTSLSIASGIAHAKNINGEKTATIAVIGDGSFTAGLVYEALNTISHLGLPIIIILNDNGMSISENIGGISSYFNLIRTSETYLKFKRRIEFMAGKMPGIGRPIKRVLYNLKESVSDILIPGKFFHDIGIAYYGPFDGHNIKKLTDIFEEIRYTEKPILLHLLTKKGKGYAPSEEDPTHYHGISGISVNCDDSIPVKADGISYSKTFGSKICELAAKDDGIFAVTAAMETGTGLTEFARLFKERFADVGIAEQHAVDFGVGLALKGYKPVVCIYSTFLQRGYDQLLHDVGIGNIKMLFCLDRAGLVPDDGETHQGIFDIAYMRMIPNFRIMLPSCKSELEMMMEFALDNLEGPCSIRYPKDVADNFIEYNPYEYPIEWGAGNVVVKGDDCILVSCGTLLKEALAARKLLENNNIVAEIFNLRFAKPINKETLFYLSDADKPVFLIEEGIESGGVGEYLYTRIKQLNPSKQVGYSAICDSFPPVGSREELLLYYDLTASKIADKIKVLVNK
jgi:1-deoxy-D-xylulose-5-phosphate synthase